MGLIIGSILGIVGLVLAFVFAALHATVLVFAAGFLIIVGEIVILTMMNRTSDHAAPTQRATPVRTAAEML